MEYWTPPGARSDVRSDAYWRELDASRHTRGARAPTTGSERAARLAFIASTCANTECKRPPLTLAATPTRYTVQPSDVAARIITTGLVAAVLLAVILAATLVSVALS